MKRILYLIVVSILAITGHCQSNKTVTLSYNFDEFQTQTTDEGLVITSPIYDVYYPSGTGEPALPYINVSILISPNESFGGYSYSKNDLCVLSNVNIAPNQDFLPTDYQPHQSHNIMEPLTYSLSEYPMNQVEYLGSSQMNGYQMITFAICPFLYNLTNRALYLMNSCSIQITLISDTSNSQNLSALRRKRMSQKIKEMVINGEDLDSLYSGTDSIVNSIKYEYLLITCDSLKNAFLPLAEWKIQKGIRSKILTVEEIDSQYSARNAPLKIKKAIDDYYKHHSTSYVLLGGDVNIVPAQLCRISWGTQVGPVPCPAYEDSVRSDLFYSCLGTMDWDTNHDGIFGDVSDSINLLPDLSVTRFPVETYTEAQVVANRVIDYEKCIDKSKYKKNILMCGKTRILGD